MIPESPRHLPQDTALLPAFHVVSQDEMDRGFEPAHKSEIGRAVTYNRLKAGYLELSEGDYDGFGGGAPPEL